MFEDILAKKNPIPERLLKYGFEENEGKYHYRTEILGGEFSLVITLDKAGNADTVLTDTDTGDEYILYKTSAAGNFVGEVRSAIEETLRDIVSECFTSSVFRYEQTLRLVERVESFYGDSPEFLWEKAPGNGIWRRKDTGKWYGALLTLPKSKLGFESKTGVEILNLRTPPEKLAALLSQGCFYPAWHMNKKNWFTIILDGSVEDDELWEMIRVSFGLAMK